MKDLISESLTIFQSQRFKKKVAEAQIELALCYWRTGEYNQATDFLNLALARLPADSDLKAKAIIRTAIIDIDAAAFPKRYDLSPSTPPSFKGLTVTRCKEAHDHLDRARHIFTSLKDKSTVAQVDETRAPRQRRNELGHPPGVEIFGAHCRTALRRRPRVGYTYRHPPPHAKI